jgi:hypothetical protein
MIKRAVSGVTLGLAAEAVQYSDEKKKPQDSFMVAGGDDWGAVELAAMMFNVSVQGKLRPCGICRSYAAHLSRINPRRGTRITLPLRRIHHIVYSKKLLPATSLLRIHVSHIRSRIVITTSHMFKAQVLRRNFSLYNRVPYSRIVRSAARDGHESVTIQRVRISRPIFSKS